MVGINDNINEIKVTPTQALPATQLATETRQTQNTSATETKNKKQLYQERMSELKMLAELKEKIQRSMQDIETVSRDLRIHHGSKEIAEYILRLLDVSLECAVDKLTENVRILAAKEKEYEQTQRRYALELQGYEQQAQALNIKLFPGGSADIIKVAHEQYAGNELTIKDCMKKQNELKQKVHELHQERAKLVKELKVLVAGKAARSGKKPKNPQLSKDKSELEKKIREKLQQLDITLRKTYSERKITNDTLQQELASKDDFEQTKKVADRVEQSIKPIQAEVSLQESKQDVWLALNLEITQVLAKQHALKQEHTNLQKTREQLQQALRAAKTSQIPNALLITETGQNLEQTINAQNHTKKALGAVYKVRVDLENKRKELKKEVQPTREALVRQKQHQVRLQKTAVKKIQAQANKMLKKPVLLNTVPTRAFSTASRVTSSLKQNKIVTLKESIVIKKLRAKYLTRSKKTVYSKYKGNRNEQFMSKLRKTYKNIQSIQHSPYNLNKHRQSALMALNNWEKHRISTYDKLFYYYTVKTPMSLYAHKAFIILEIQLNASLVRMRLVPYLFLVTELCFYRIIRVNNSILNTSYYILSLYDNVTIPVALHNYLYYRNYRVQFYPKLLSNFFKQYWLHFSNWNQNKVWLLTNFLVSNLTAEAVVFDYPNIVSYISPFRRFTNMFYRNQQYTELAKSDEQYLTVSYSHTIIKLKLFSYTTYYR